MAAVITLHKNLRTPLAALLPLDVWEVNIESSDEVTLVMSEFTLDISTVFGLQVDVLGSERGICFTLNMEESWDDQGNPMGADFLQFVVHWGRNQAMGIHTLYFQVSSDAQAQKMTTGLQDVLNALLQSAMPLDPGVALDWMMFTAGQLKRHAILAQMEG